MTNPQLVRIATIASVSVAITLLVIKFYAWLQTDSVSILASTLDSAFDIIASLMIMMAVYIAQIPADKEHRFGHGKAEPLAALAQSVFIAGSAVYLMVYSLERIWTQAEVEKVNIGLAVMILSLVLTTGLVIFQKYVVRKTESTAIAADALHYLSDVLATLLIIVSLFFVSLNWIDPLLAILIAVWILHSAYQIAKDSLNQLLDRELSDEMRAEISEIILSTPQVLGFNDLRSYQSGPNRFVQLDLELDDKLTLLAAHDIAEQVTSRLKTRFENLDVIVHQEPASLRHDHSHHTWGKEYNE
ncbi:cation diffusion facilitator family transporter [Thiomicrorhabdus sp. 6S2-11]|jgi:ferrous-iron efflux pump FieF|uniref:Cation diffusion facilitator family transporter n=1 Tax=Thiomicrorhabdus marina TaxID=2818442 RepID=A0ABS3Q4Z8_9GAMM|nr:cation diffusion facilitator family transporter [Thiomicrorhabdus marina]MBO1927352.1 cation diffusion facilitator family transporter [Thiomicrorhabdus marina]